MAAERLVVPQPNDKQRLFLLETHKNVAFGGARGGGKSWAVRTKAKALCGRYPGIRCLIVRRSYPELQNNHIRILRQELVGAARYNDRDKLITFYNGSTIGFTYCARDADLDRLQGTEYDVIFFDEATQLTEFQIKSILACLRGANNFPKRAYYTCNPGGQGHGYIKRLFIDRQYQDGEDAEDYAFIQSLVTDNKALMEAQPEYVRQLEALPPKLREAWLYGRWDIFEGQFFEEFTPRPPADKAAELGLSQEELAARHEWCHVIPAFDLSRGDRRGWTIVRSYDFGYAKPFSVGWYAVDYDGVIYRIMELYGCTDTPNEGVKWTPERQAEKVAEIERTHPWLAGRQITGVADPSIWDASRGESVAETFSRHGVFFTPGDNNRIAGWMQCHYRLMMDDNGRSMFYVFDNCKSFIRTIPLLQFDETHVEDLDTDGEDHIADEWRYLCMSRPIRPSIAKEEYVPLADPLGQFDKKRR